MQCGEDEYDNHKRIYDWSDLRNGPDPWREVGESERRLLQRNPSAAAKEVNEHQNVYTNEPARNYTVPAGAYCRPSTSACGATSDVASGAAPGYFELEPNSEEDVADTVPNDSTVDESNLPRADGSSRRPIPVYHKLEKEMEPRSMDDNGVSSAERGAQIERRLREN